jgi:hypothetical protein
MVAAKFAVGIWMVIWPERRPAGTGANRVENRRPHSRGVTASAIARQPDIPLEATPHAIQTESPQNTGPDSPSQPAMSRTRSAFLLGLAMVARGEIALIVAQLARPLLSSDQNGVGGSGVAESEPFAVVIWAILISTVGGAVGVGIVLRTRKGADGFPQR